MYSGQILLKKQFYKENLLFALFFYIMMLENY